MRTKYTNFLSKIKDSDLITRTETLNRTTFRQSFAAYHAEAEHILAEMKRLGLPNAEIISFPADGKTVYEDKIMPMGWDATSGRLTLLDKDKTVAADYAKEPLSLIKGSVATAPGGEILRIITQAQLLAGEECRNALVMLNPEVRPAANAFKPTLDLGARGFISDFLPHYRYVTPDEIHWVNAGTETDAWHVIDGDRPFIGFQVSPRMGDKIRKMASDGYLTALVESDGQRHTDTLPAVTALLPGRRPEELWIIAHTAEPFLDDDAAGIVAGMEIMRQMMACGPHEYSLRLLFTMEVYGFAAFHATFKGKAIGACNIDSLACQKNVMPTLIPPIPNKPFAGTDILQKLYNELHDRVPMAPLSIPQCFDDMCLSDSTIGIPTIWFEMRNLDGKPNMWHNSFQRKTELLDKDIFDSTTALAATWTQAMLNTPVPELPARMPSHSAEMPSGPWREYANQQIYARNCIGLPKDQAAVPRQLRHTLPDNILYGPMATILSEMDGRRTLGEIILDTEAIRKTTLSEDAIKKAIDAINFLADWGYLTPVQRTELTEEQLAQAIQKAGVRKGDLLLVHASLSKCGYVKGGARTLIQAILNTIGPTGTALFTTFTRPYIMLGGQINRSWSFRPFDATDLSQIWTGEVGRTLLRDFPEAIRSRHITHSWAGMGALAKEILDLHGAADAPCGDTSPLAEALRHQGKILFAGSGLAPNTFLHYIETKINPGLLGQALCSVRNPDGSTRMVTIEHHLPGHRNFYGADARNGKFYKRALEAGLQVHEAKAGMGAMQVVSMKQLWEIGSALMQQDPAVTLCDNTQCLFCHSHH